MALEAVDLTNKHGRFPSLNTLLNSLLEKLANCSENDEFASLFHKLLKRVRKEKVEPALTDEFMTLLDMFICLEAKKQWLQN